MVPVLDECIEWQGRVTSTGYGADGRSLAHRTTWIRHHGPIPTGMVIHHLCGNKLCVNLEHLRCITHAEHNLLHLNATPWYERQRAKTHCPAGHEYTAENTMVKRGKRHCRVCERRRFREWYHRKKMAA